ncbi:hypothetical protein BDV95DRAFT_301020 [Massariosphaeria phaeospora]|uniref:Uncharacterized protein n=1 Tax=Massariosphaeria phaeospora TaxID=100035 RepID=A0A7C8MGL3_9PLEO|nr:hypothetical protein BDV95DRAFT_301020 [Massariosphaeria phaeospora]
MPHPLQLLIYPGGFLNTSPGRVPAHWALFIASPTNPRIAKTFDAVGTPFTGYGLRFRRNYSLDDETRRFSVVWVVDVEEGLVEDMRVYGEGEGENGRKGVTEDVEPRDRLEREAKRVDAPGVSKRPLDPFGGRNCQSWVLEYVGWLAERKLVDGSALEALEKADRI